MRNRNLHVGEALPADADDTLQHFLDYWRSKCPADGVARRRAIDPLEIVRLLPWIFILDVEADDFRFSLVGQEIVDRYGHLRGKRLGEVMVGRELRETLAEHRQCVESRQPVFSQNTERSARPGDWQLYQRLLAPLADEGGDVTALAGVMVFRSYAETEV